MNWKQKEKKERKIKAVNFIFLDWVFNVKFNCEMKWSFFLSMLACCWWSWASLRRFFFSLINVVHDLIKYFQTLELIILQHSTALLPTIKKNYFNINNCDLISCRTIHSTFFIFVFAIHKDVSMFECHFMHIQIFIVYSSGNANALFLNAGIWTFKFHSNLII